MIIVAVNAGGKSVQIRMKDQFPSIFTEIQKQEQLLRQNTSDKFVFMVDEGKRCDLDWCIYKCIEIVKINPDFFSDVEASCYYDCVCKKIQP